MTLLPAHFHFLAPVWLWGLLALPLVLLAIWRQRRDGDFSRLADSSLLPHLLTGKARHRAAPALLAALVWLLGCLALAGPSWQQLPVPLMQQQPAQVIALSLAQTMYANDLPPSRMERARFKVSDLLDANRAGLNALIGFAGDAFVVAPLTRDSHSLSALLAAMSPSTMPVDGDNAAAAIKQAVHLLKEANADDGLILLLADNANQAAIDAARQAHAQGMTVSVLGIGRNDKKPVTLPDGTLLHDASGNLVLSQREDTRLADVAAAGGGRYLVATDGKADVLALEQGLHTDQRQQLKQEINHWRDAGPWLLLPLLALLALLFRRGWLLVLLLMPLAAPQPAQADGWQQQWQNLWLRPDQQAARALADGKPADAEKLAKDPDWKGAGAYEAGHYQAALDAWQHSTSPDASYNLGNAQAQLGDYDAAIASYEKALKQNPDNADARTNLELLKKLKQQQQQKDKQGQGNDKNNEQKQDQKQGKGDSQKDDKNNGQNGKQDDSKADSKNSQDKSQDGQQKDGQKQQGQQQGQQQQDKPQPQNQTEQQADKQATDQAQKALAQQLDQELDKDGKPATPAKVNDLGTDASQDSLKQLPAGTRQLLLAVPDDPGALLQRKFELEYRQRQSGEQ